MAAKKIYPDWVQKYRTQGTTIKKVGESFYIYKRTSKRVPGKKYPQPVDVFLGKVTQNGIIYSTKKNDPLTSEVSRFVDVREYGFSYVLWEICPQEWKNQYQKNWEEYLKVIICEQSRQSYLKKEQTIRKKEEYTLRFDLLTASLSRCLMRSYGITLKDLEILKYIYVVYQDGKKLYSCVDETQQRLLERLGVQLFPTFSDLLEEPEQESKKE